MHLPSGAMAMLHPALRWAADILSKAPLRQWVLGFYFALQF